MGDKRELTAVEVLKTISEICISDACCELCPLNGVHCFCNSNSGIHLGRHAEKVVEVCTKWHEEHQKPIETEWVWVNRIYGVKPNGERVFCKQYSADDYVLHKDAEDVLAKFVEENPPEDYTEYISIVEKTCRVKM